MGKTISSLTRNHIRKTFVYALLFTSVVLFALYWFEVGKFFIAFKHSAIFAATAAVFVGTAKSWLKPLILFIAGVLILAFYIFVSGNWTALGVIFVFITILNIVTDSAKTKAFSKEPAWIKPAVLIVVFLFLTVFVFLPLYTIFTQAFAKGALTYLASIRESDAWSAIKLTLIVAAVTVPVNTFFGVLLAWAIAKFDFKGKNIITTLIEVPFAISPVIAGLIFILLFGASGWFGEYLIEHNVKIVFALPGLFLATAFVTFPFVARELIPLMQEMGKDDEEAALTLGAGGLQTFFKVTLPNIKWGLLYGIVLTNARAMGEFGAVAVVSGLVRGVTMTMPLHIEVLYNEYLFAASFAVASLLTLLALVTLIVKTIIEHFIALQRKRAFKAFE
ncbi:MAG: sulfate ABC transporter permease subunit CysW [Campylobacteraceae bacterium]|jgi:sulfate transport system permease protein|nr:sulfate ABC transporter permease subunit CysW [Campylobacteraceae bacterium]